MWIKVTITCVHIKLCFFSRRYKQLNSFGLLLILFFHFLESANFGLPVDWQKYENKNVNRSFGIIRGGWTITHGLNSAPAFRNGKRSVQVWLLCSFWMWLEQWSQSAVLSQYINTSSSVCLLTYLSRSGFSCDVELMNCFNASIPLVWWHITHVKCSMPDLMDGDYLYWLIAVV